MLGSDPQLVAEVDRKRGEEGGLTVDAQYASSKSYQCELDGARSTHWRSKKFLNCAQYA